jgi:small subunit ribosomal protein S21
MKDIRTTGDPDTDFRRLFTAFKKNLAQSGVLQEYKKHEFYESPSEKRRRKQREAKVQRLKDKLRENFPEKRKN